MSSKKIIKILTGLSVAGLLIFLGVNAYIHRPNIGVVNGYKGEPKIFRSAQLTAERLEQLLEEEEIDVVLNLRGINEGAPWYDAEKALLEELDIEYVSRGFGKNNPPTKKRFLKILDLLEEVNASGEELLIHCRAGADRTGLISAITQIHLYGYSVDQAMEESLKQFRFGHIYNENAPIEQVLFRYKPYYEKGMGLREWITNHYDREAIIKYSEEHNAIW